MAIILTRNLVGAPATDFCAAVKVMAHEQARTGEYGFIYIVPTRRRVRELQRELVEDVCFGKPPIYTLELFANEIFTALSTGRRVISPSMQGMLISRILSEGEFKFFRFSSVRTGSKKGVAPAGTIKKIVDQINYLEENGITPGDYKTMLAAAEGSEIQKLGDFLSIYSEYLNRLGTKLVDSAGVLSLVNREIEQSGTAIPLLFPGKRTIFVEGFYDFKKPELDFLRTLSGNKDFSFSIRLDCTESNPHLFRTMLATSSELIARGFKYVSEGIEPVSDENSKIREFLAGNLFSDKVLHEKLKLTGKVSTVSGRDKLGEAEFVARKIKRIMKEFPDQPLHRICVASYLPQNYSSIFREVFQKYRIPSNITDRLTLESNGVVNAILSLIDILLTDYERNSILRALTNRAISIGDGFEPNRAASVIRNAAVLCRFERGHDAFKEVIGMRLEFLRKLDKDDAEDNAEQIARDIRTLDEANMILDAIERALAGFETDLTPEEFRRELRSLVDRLGIRKNTVSGSLDSLFTDLAERDARALTSFFDVLDELVEVETARGSGKLPVAIWMDNLRSALSLTRYNVRQKYGYGAYVTSLEEIRGLEFDYIFILGLNEGELPARYDPEILLPLKVQQENREMNPYLQRYLFYQAASSFRKELYLVHPARKDEIRLARSSFIDAFLEIANVAELNGADAAGEVADVYNVHDMIDAYSKLSGYREAIREWDESHHVLPPNIDRCMTAEAARVRDVRDSEFHGRISDGAIAGAIDSELSERVYSSSQIESLARCGFQFFARRILKIIETPEVETSLSPIERGTVLHKILYRFYTELARLGKTVDAQNQTALLKSVGKSVLAEFGMMPADSDDSSAGSVGSNRAHFSANELFEIEKDIMLGTESVPGTLDLFLSKVQSKLSEYGFVPEKFELSFGMTAGNSRGATDPVKIGEAIFRGKIDRIDVGPEGAVVFDYKTSSVIPSHRDVVWDKINPQLLIYMNALKAASPDSDMTQPVGGAAFLSLNRDKLLNAKGEKDSVKFIVSDEEGELKYSEKYHGAGRTHTETYPQTMDALFKETEEFVSRITNKGRSGRFNLTEFAWERVCKYCPYSHACRVALRGEGGDEAAELSESA